MVVDHAAQTGHSSPSSSGDANMENMVEPMTPKANSQYFPKETPAPDLRTPKQVLRDTVDEVLKKAQLAALDGVLKEPLCDDVKGMIALAYNQGPKLTPASLHEKMFRETWRNNKDVLAFLIKIDAEIEQNVRKGLRNWRAFYLVSASFQ